MFPLPNRVQYLHVIIYSPEKVLNNFINPTDLFHSSACPPSKASNLHLSVCVYVEVSAAYSATLQTKQTVPSLSVHVFFHLKLCLDFKPVMTGNSFQVLIVPLRKCSLTQLS